MISETVHNAALLNAPIHQTWIKFGLQKFTNFEKLQKCVKQGSGYFFSHLMHLQKSYIPDISSFWGLAITGKNWKNKNSTVSLWESQLKWTSNGVVLVGSGSQSGCTIRYSHRFFFGVVSKFETQKTSSKLPFWVRRYGVIKRGNVKIHERNEGLISEVPISTFDFRRVIKTKNHLEIHLVSPLEKDNSYIHQKYPKNQSSSSQGA